MALRSGHLKTAALLVVSAAFILALPATASAAKVVNGGFETGALTGWMTVTQHVGGAGTWSAYTGTTAPYSNDTVPAPPQGKYAAIADETEESSEIMYQDIKLARRQRHVLSLYAYYDAYAPMVAAPSLSYSYNSGKNEQYRIDAMKPSAPLDSVSSGILKTVFATKTGASETMAPQLLKTNLSSLAGKTIRLRFAMVAGEYFMQAGTDAVMITSTPLVKTGKAKHLKSHSAKLGGAVDPNGGPTTYFFQYGKTTHYGKRSKVEKAGSGNAFEKEFASIKGLSPGTTYHYRIVARNAAAKSHGKDHTFTTA